MFSNQHPENMLIENKFIFSQNFEWDPDVKLSGTQIDIKINFNQLNSLNFMNRTRRLIQAV